MQAMPRIMHGNVKVCKSGMSLCIQKNVVGFDIAVHYALAMKIRHTRGQLCCPEANYGLRKVTLGIYVISKITTKHEVKNEEAIIIVLESIAEVAQERVIDLLKQSPFLDDVSNSLLSHALLLVHVLERVEFLALFMLDDTNLAKGTFTDHSVEVEVIEGNLGGEVDILRRSTTHG